LINVVAFSPSLQTGIRSNRKLCGDDETVRVCGFVDMRSDSYDLDAGVESDFSISMISLLVA
jgi:hypothetical protein